MKKFFLILFCTLLFTGCIKKETKTTISFSSWGSKSELNVLKPTLKEFENKNPNIKINFIHAPKNYFQKLHLLVASNLTPDVIFINNINGQIYIQNDILLDLTNYLKYDKDLNKNNFFESTLKAFTYQNKLYAVPRDVSNLVIYYNKDLFDKYKIPYPTENWTFNDYLKISQQLTKDYNNDGQIDLFGTGFEENSLFWTPFLWSNGGGILSDDAKKILINNPESIETIQFYSDLRNKYHTAPTASESASATMTQMFLQQKIAMQINGRWNVPALRQEAEFNWDIVPFPKGNKGSIVDADASGWAISKNCKHPDEAWKFIKFLANSKTSTEFTKSGLIIPARIDVANSKYFLDNQSPKNAKVFIEVLKTAKPTPTNQNYSEITNLIDEVLEPVWGGEKTAKQAIDANLITKINKLIE